MTNRIDRAQTHLVNEYVLRAAAKHEPRRADYLTKRADEELDAANNYLSQALTD
jgi:hypothetical protein